MDPGAEEPGPPLRPTTVLAAFLRAWFADEEQGVERSLEEYQALFPGHEAEIAEAWPDLRGRSTLARRTRPEILGAGDLPARTAIGPYRILELLGRGGQGLVFLAHDPRLDRRVAIKVLTAAPSLVPEESLARFRREAEVAARLRHPFICPVYEMDRDGDHPYIVMAHVEGLTLARAIAEAGPKGPPGPEGVRRWTAFVEDAARALHVAHEAGIVHRDIKPGNLMVTESGAPMILDFGLARDVSAASLTATGALLGTLAYMAPEQLRGAPLDRRTDVYALGVTLYECLTHELPFPAASEAGIIQAALRDEPADPHLRNPAVPRDLAVVLGAALEKDPERRYRSAHDFAEELRRVREGRPVLAQPAGPLVRLWRWAHRRPALAAAIAGLILTLSAGLLIALILLAQVQRAQEETTHLADVKRLADLVLEADGLWPAVPDRISALEAWLARARPLHDRLELHRAALVRLRSSASGTRADGTPVFGGDWDSWRYQVLETLVRDLAAFETTIRSVEERLAFARTVKANTVEEHREDWVEDAAYAERPGPYGGHRLNPQVGLVPLGADPDSGLLEYAHLASGDPARRDPGSGRLRLGPKFGVVLVLVPGGRGRMGTERPGEGASGAGEFQDPTAEAWESPAHEVELAPYFISKYEASQGQWQRWTGGNPSRYPHGMKMDRGEITALHPVESVTWGEARSVLRRLGLELPTEAQWERAARAGTGTRFWTGNDIGSLLGAANVKDRSCARVIGTDLSRHEEELDDGWPAHAPVTSLHANPFGLHGVIGNVQEWCLDPFGPYKLPARDGDGLRETPEDGYRTFRGGSYLQMAWNARSSNRAKVRETLTDFTVGLRPARALDR